MGFVSGRKVKILGTGIYVPEKVMYNSEFESFLDTSDTWIRERTGIEKRHFAAKGQKCSDLAYLAALDVLKKTGLPVEKLDMIIIASNTPDSLIPCMASKVQGRLNAVNAGAYDLQAGCTGSLTAMQNAIMGIACGLWDNVLVIGSEAFEKIMDWSDRGTCILFGDAAGACILSVADESEKQFFISAKLTADGLKHDYITNENNGDNEHNYLRMKGHDVFKYVSLNLPKFINEFCSESKVDPTDVDFWVLHQANTRIIDGVFKRVGISTDRTLLNLGKYGNTSAASMLVALDESYREGRIKRGEKVAFIAFGAGMTLGGLLYNA
ncbi:MAG: beta-ketoacyl-ACP synthase III [Synergistaceae bacterium]